MTPIGFHVRMSVEGRRVVAATPAALRTGARVLLDQGAQASLLAFRLADSHLHTMLTCSRGEAGAFVHRVECALGWELRLGAPFERPHFEPVYTQRHLTKAFWYILRQEQHHGTALDPLHEGSSLYDTLGLRVVDPALPGRVARALPRTSREELAGLLGPSALGLIDTRGSGPLELSLLPDAAAAALALPDVHSKKHALARRSAITVALANVHRWYSGRSNGHAQALARALGLSWWTTHRLESRPPDAASHTPELDRAVLQQWQLRSGLDEPSLHAAAPRAPDDSELACVWGG